MLFLKIIYVGFLIWLFSMFFILIKDLINRRLEKKEAYPERKVMPGGK